jgi:hypothetical protein
MFEGCEMLNSFNYPLKSLLSGINMFTGCQLDIYSIRTILDSLPDVTNGKGVKLNDYSLTDEEVNAILQNIITYDVNCVKDFSRDKANSSFSFYIKGISIAFDPSAN